MEPTSEGRGSDDGPLDACEGGLGGEPVGLVACGQEQVGGKVHAGAGQSADCGSGLLGQFVEFAAEPFGLLGQHVDAPGELAQRPPGRAIHDSFGVAVSPTSSPLHLAMTAESLEASGTGQRASRTPWSSISLPSEIASRLGDPSVGKASRSCCGSTFPLAVELPPQRAAPFAFQHELERLELTAVLVGLQAEYDASGLGFPGR